MKMILKEISTVGIPNNMYKLIRRLNYYNINYNDSDGKTIRECIQKRWDARREERELKKILNTGDMKKRGRL